MDRALLDTCTVSDVIRPASKRRATIAQHLKQYLRSHGRLTFSEITCYEILRGLRKKQAVLQEQQFVGFCQHVELIPVSLQVLDRAAALWSEGSRHGKSTDDSNLIIAATALEQQMPLVTSNAAHFDWIKGLQLLNWREA
jgi:tRNA(fMet)-specific endonuclease VapC